MLYTGADTHILDTTSEPCAKLTCNKGILGEILKVSSAKRITLNIHRRAENEVYAVMTAFLTHSLTHFIEQILVPGVTAGAGRRETGRGLCLTESRRLIIHLLLTKTVRSVGKHYRGETYPAYLIGKPGFVSREKANLLFYCELG